MRYLVLDSGMEIGDTWRGRWDSLRLFTPAEYCSCRGCRSPLRPGTYPTKDEVADYLKRYATKFELPGAVQPSLSAGSRTTVMCSTLETSRASLRARQVVVATGPFGAVRSSRRLAQQFAARRQASSTAPNTCVRADVPQGRVLVVGAGNSGLQIAAKLAATREVHVAMGSKQRMGSRSAPFGGDLFWWLSKTRLLNPPQQTPASPACSAVERGDLVIGTSNGLPCGAAGVTLYRPSHWRRGPHPAQLVARSQPRDRRRGVGATGFRPDYSWIDIDGVWGRRTGRPPARSDSATPGLWFIGLPWQHTRGSALLGFVKDDAAWVTAQLNEHDGATGAKAA